MTTTTETLVRFLQNGLKIGSGKIQKAHYSYSPGHVDDYGHGYSPHVTVYGEHYVRFSREVAAELTIANNTDTMTDYFENDRISIAVDHPRFPDVAAAYIAKEESLAASRAKRRGEQVAPSATLDELRALVALDAEERWCVARDWEIANLRRPAEVARERAADAAAWQSAPVELVAIAATTREENSVAVLCDWIEEHTGRRPHAFAAFCKAKEIMKAQRIEGRSLVLLRGGRDARGAA